MADRPGYSFENASKTRASYFVAMEAFGLISEEGTDLSQERWLDTSFCLPFKLSSELANYGPDLSEKVLQQPIIPNGKYSLFLEFEEPTTYVIRYYYHCYCYKSVDYHITISYRFMRLFFLLG